MMFPIVFLSCAALLSACVTPTERMDPRVRDRIAECNAGSSVTLNADLTAKVGKNLQEGISATAGVSEEIKGLFLNEAAVTEQNAVELYEKYSACLETIRGK